jgi:alpha-amylase
MIPLGEYARTNPALGRIYIPTSSYIEMTEWSLPPQKAYTFSKVYHQLEQNRQYEILQFMRGGFWRNFLVRYAEVNNQHKKMLRVHDHVYAAGATEEHGLIHLWKAQANDTYWHGLFGGIYMTHVRSAIYHHLLKAENAADCTRYGTKPWQHYEFTDFDRDTHNELIIESDQQNLYIDQQRGGSIFEWDIRRSAHNLTSVMTRREESYHQTLREYEQRRRASSQTGSTQTGSGEPGSPHTTVRTKEPGLDQYLILDRYPRSSLIDHFLPPGLPLESFQQVRYEDQGNFIDAPYEITVEQNSDGVSVLLSRDGQIKRAGALTPLPVQVRKTLFLPIGEEKLIVRYSIENKGQSRLQTYFASEWNFNLLGGGGNDQAYYHIEGHKLENSHFDSTGEVPLVRSFHIGNTWLQQDLAFHLNQETTLWRFSIETVTGSEAGFERTHQGSCVTLVWPLVLEAGQQWDVEIKITGSASISRS